MRKRIWLVVAAGLAVGLSVGVATASAGGGNSPSAKLCQRGGWMHLQGSDGTQFASETECVSFGAHGGTIVPKATTTCTAGSENFSGDADLSQPTTFAGGTIDTSYGVGGGIHTQPDSWGGGFPSGTHLLFTGEGANSFRLTFTNAVASVQLDQEPNLGSPTDTLTAYDASGNVVGSDAEPTAQDDVVTLSVSSTNDNIKYFTIATDDPFQFGIGFTNIVWGCAA